MIISFADKATLVLFEGGKQRKFRAFQNQAERKPQLLDSAAHREFLRTPPGNRLKKISGYREGQYSIRVNKTISDMLLLGRRPAQPERSGNHGLSLRSELYAYQQHAPHTSRRNFERRVFGTSGNVG
jgi:plasmid maintenance system killer protein